MRLLIFGASGKTGRHLLTQGLLKGHMLTAFVRRPGGLGIQDSRLAVFQGDVLDAGRVAEAIRGQSAVISVLGNPTRQAIRERLTNVSAGIRNIISGMKAAKVKRLVFVSAFGINERIFWPEKAFIRLFLNNLFSELPEQERLIRESGLDWTIVRPARLTNGTRTKQYRVGADLYIHPFSHIARADVADCLLEVVVEPAMIGSTITIAS